jgi:hypothetical protein
MTEDLPAICLGCGRINVNGQWINSEYYFNYFEIRRKLDDVGRYCPECTEKFKKQYQELKRNYQLLRN